MLSAQICLPFSNNNKSSKTTSVTAISRIAPARFTIAVGADINDNLSIVFLALISWIIPIVILAVTIARNTKSENAWIEIRTPAIVKHKILKNVKIFEKKINICYYVKKTRW